MFHDVRMMMMMFILIMMYKVQMMMSMMMMISGSRWLQGTDQCEQARRVWNLRTRSGGFSATTGWR